MANNEKILVDGLGFKDPINGAPDFVLGTISLKIKKLLEWTEQNKEYESERGWMFIDVLRSRNGEPYLSLNTYKPNHDTAGVAKKAIEQDNMTSDGSINIDDIPF